MRYYDDAGAAYYATKTLGVPLVKDTAENHTLDAHSIHGYVGTGRRAYVRSAWELPNCWHLPTGDEVLDSLPESKKAALVELGLWPKHE